MKIKLSRQDISALGKRLAFVGASPGGAGLGNPVASAEAQRDSGSIPGSGRSPGEGHGNPLQYSCLENPTDRRAWWATFHRVTKSQTQMKRLSTHARSGSIDHMDDGW